MNIYVFKEQNSPQVFVYKDVQHSFSGSPVKHKSDMTRCDTVSLLKDRIRHRIQSEDETHWYCISIAILFWVKTIPCLHTRRDFSLRVERISLYLLKDSLLCRWDQLIRNIESVPFLVDFVSQSLWWGCNLHLLLSHVFPSHKGFIKAQGLSSTEVKPLHTLNESNIADCLLWGNDSYESHSAAKDLNSPQDLNSD